MVWDKSGTTKEVESLKKRFPKRGIDPTIPAEIRQTLRDREQEKEMTMGEKNRYARGGMTPTPRMTPTSSAMTPTSARTPTSSAAYARGGSASSRADGCARKGKTKGMMR